MEFFVLPWSSLFCRVLPWHLWATVKTRGKQFIWTTLYNNSNNDRFWTNMIIKGSLILLNYRLKLALLFDIESSIEVKVPISLYHNLVSRPWVSRAWASWRISHLVAEKNTRRNASVSKDSITSHFNPFNCYFKGIIR